MDTTALAAKSAGLVWKWLKARQAKNERDWIDRCLVDFSQISGVVVVALLSHAVGKPWFDDEVQKLLSSLIDDPAAPARAHRLLGEVLKSPSREKRARLAAVFVAGPRICTTPDDCDRLDALVERLFDDDVAALHQLAACDSVDGFLLEEPHRQAAVSGKRRFCAKTGPLEYDALPTLPAVVVDDLQALGVIREMGGQHIDSAEHVFLRYFMTELGRFLQRALQHEAIRAGVDAAARDESKS